MISDWTLWLEWFIKSVILIFALLGGFAYLTWYERRALARIQTRIGPNRAGPFGLLQPIADAVKLIFKEELTPAKAFKFVFFLAPILTVVPSIIIARRSFRGGARSTCLGARSPCIWRILM
jgi:NADH-quinone oxidoreductase subunit H